MKRMSVKGLLCFVLLSVVAVAQVQAQYMPVVFDKKYGDTYKIMKVCPVDGDEIIMAGKDGSTLSITWLDRNGDVVFTRTLKGFTEINELKQIEGNRMLLVGQSDVISKSSVTGRSGRAVIIDNKGDVKVDVYVGGQGSSILQGEMLRNGALMLGGYELKADGGKKGMIAKVGTNGTVHYKYNPVEGDVCTSFEVLGNVTEYICAAFSAENEDGKASVVRLDDKGKPYFVTPLPARNFKVTSIKSNIVDGSTIIIGSSSTDGGIVYKLRPEGDVVFGKTIVPAEAGATMTDLYVARNGNILVGGSGSRGYYAMLRNDGTSLINGVVPGQVTGVGMNVVTGESVVASFDRNSRRGTFNRISGKGVAEFQKVLDGNFDNVFVSANSEVLLMSSSEGRVCMFSAFGDKLSDRFVSGDRPAVFDKAMQASSGEVIFAGMDNRLVKLAHGLYVSDVKITKPVNGYATASFTVTLTGFSTTKEGAPIPVNVSYATKEGSANVKNNFTAVGGQLSFTPTKGEANRFLLTQDIEVPVKANSYVEGVKEFEMLLSDVKNSYIIKASGKGVVEDQQAVVKLIRAEGGIEASKDVVYELGLFKTDGTALENATGSNIIVDGSYGEGTADALDFDMGLTPRIVFANGKHNTSFNVNTLSDTRYEMPKTVVINFDKVYTISGANVGFDGALLSCTGTIVDQPAAIAIASLGDHRVNDNVVSGFFTVSLVRASDGALLTNATGSDIAITCSVASQASAKEGKDFVLTNAHNLRIGGDGNQSTVNINGVVLYSEFPADKEVTVTVDSVTTPAGAQPISVKPDGKTASFTIKK